MPVTAEQMALTRLYMFPLVCFPSSV